MGVVLILADDANTIMIVEARTLDVQAQSIMHCSHQQVTDNKIMDVNLTARKLFNYVKHNR